MQLRGICDHGSGTRPNRARPAVGPRGRPRRRAMGRPRPPSVRLHGHAVRFRRSDRLGHGHHHLERERIMDARGAPTLHLDGRDLVPHAPVGRLVPGHRPMGQSPAGPAGARERNRMRNLRDGIGVFRRDVRDDLQDRAAGTRQARLQREHRHRFAGWFRHARPAPSALDHHDRVRGAGGGFARADVSRGLHSGRPRHAALFRIHWNLGAAQPFEATAA